MSAPLYQIIRRPIITEKGLGVKETQHTVVFEVSPSATKIFTARCAAADRTKGTGAIGRKPT